MFTRLVSTVDVDFGEFCDVELGFFSSLLLSTPLLAPVAKSGTPDSTETGSTEPDWLDALSDVVAMVSTGPAERRNGQNVRNNSLVQHILVFCLGASLALC